MNQVAQITNKHGASRTGARLASAAEALARDMSHRALTLSPPRQVYGVRCASDLPAVRAGCSLPQPAFRPFGSRQVSWHAAALGCPHKSLRFAASDPGKDR